MPCNCNKNKAGTWVFVKNGSTYGPFPSEVQAKAEQIRRGGGGEVKPG